MAFPVVKEDSLPGNLALDLKGTGGPRNFIKSGICSNHYVHWTLLDGTNGPVRLIRCVSYISAIINHNIKIIITFICVRTICKGAKEEYLQRLYLFHKTLSQFLNVSRRFPIRDMSQNSGHDFPSLLQQRSSDITEIIAFPAVRALLPCVKSRGQSCLDRFYWGNM